jgi:hypothetical protein
MTTATITRQNKIETAYGSLTLANHVKAIGGGFHGHRIRATLNEMNAAFGAAPRRAFTDGKVAFEWRFKLGDETLWLYDWKEDWANLTPNTAIDWHIGTKHIATAQAAYLILDEAVTQANRIRTINIPL